MAKSRDTGETAKQILERTAQNRKDRLRELIDSEYAGRVAFFCQKNNLSRSRASHISQVLNGHRRLGEQGARQLEMDCGVRKGYLDRPPKPVAETAPLADEA